MKTNRSLQAAAVSKNFMQYFAAKYTDISSQCGGIMSVTYSPSMIQTAIQDMVDYLDGKEVTQDHVIACENVTPDNVTEYKSFS